ncbi:MAG: MGMT family protein [Bacteroidetes bacterium]|nr:MAG: MGMT family protein [Bacteroidota bacterium]
MPTSKRVRTNSFAVVSANCALEPTTKVFGWRKAARSITSLLRSNCELASVTRSNDSFFQDVWEVARLVPKGRVTTYGAIARYLGSPGAARMVGWAMNASHNSAAPVPAQRVVNRIGMLSGKAHFDGPNLMQELLENEGIQVKDNQVVDFEKHFWDPMQELTLEP